MRTVTNIKAGVIEGFFGRPWDWSARLSGADFLGDCGLGYAANTCSIRSA